MRVVLDNERTGSADVELTITDPNAVVGDLLSALSEYVSPNSRNGHEPGVVLDGQFCHADLSLDEIGLHEGSTLVPGPPLQDIESPAPAALELRVVGGLDAGRWMALRAGDTITVGRDPRADLRLNDSGVSRQHLEVTAGVAAGATVTDLDSANGTWVEGTRLEDDASQDVAANSVIEAGDVALSVVATPTAPPLAQLRDLGPGGTIPFNRPPRRKAPEEPGPLTVPEKQNEASKPHFSLISAVGPLVMGGVMVMLLHNITYALFMLLSPVMLIGSFLEQKRTAGKTNRGNRGEHMRELKKFRTDVRERRVDELIRRREWLPDPAELGRRAAVGDPRLWERRPRDADFMILNGGYAKLPFTPDLKEKMSAATEAERVLKRYGRLPPAPAEVNLAKGGAVGIVGPREEALAVARSLLCQACTLHGPADLQVAVLTDAAGAPDWEFSKWFPHGRDLLSGGSRRLLAADPDAAEQLLANYKERRESDPRVMLAVLDSASLIEGRGAVGRTLLREQEVSGIVIATGTERLPASCTTVIELSGQTAEARLTRPQLGEHVDPLLATGISAATARSTALALSRFEDADLELEGGSLPTDVSLLSLLGLGEPTPAGLEGRWSTNTGGRHLNAAFALEQDGPLMIDLVGDGPHGLIAGTTGAGKSELLRSLVASLAANYSPEWLNFVLIDYKGGSAFARASELPHTVGMVTDLDDQLGQRALESLEAELRFREHTLREHGADDLMAMNRLVESGQAKPLPRLMVIIDEFATLASELPDFITSLVGIAQRGRSLGVHMILATQRPSGAVNENIRANTNLRICLRVQNPTDSTDVIDAPAASHISRAQPGRAFVRLGPAELVPIQTALVTGATEMTSRVSVRVREFSFTTSAVGAEIAAEARPKQGESDLDRLVVAAVEAHATSEPPRRPWLEPLPPDLALETLSEMAPAHPGRAFAGDHGLVAPFVLVDDPQRQAQYPAGWNLDAGNLWIVGIGGSGTTTALFGIATTLASQHSPEDLHIYALDFGAAELAPLADLPHTGAVVGASENERQVRLLRMLRAEVNARREAGPAAARHRIVLLLDGYGSFTSENSDLAGDAVRDDFARVWSDGPEVGVHVAITADRPGAVPNALASLAQQRIFMQLADASDYAGFGLRRGNLPKFAPGRGVLLVGDPMVLQVARSHRPMDQVIAQIRQRWEGANRRLPRRVGTLPERLSVSELVAAAQVRPPDSEGLLWLPMAIDDQTLSAAGWTLYPGEHGLISGPPRSGRSTALMTIAQVARALNPELGIWVVAFRRSAVADMPGLWGRATSPAELPELMAAMRERPEPALLLIDDADNVDDTDRSLSMMIGAHDSPVHVIAAARPETLRALGHWTSGIRGGKNGMLITPDLNVDGGVFGLALPRRPAPPVRPGCGYLVRGGVLGLAQVADADR